MLKSLRTSQALLFVFLALCVTFLSGCYSFTASTLPSHIKTVNIHEVDDKTMDAVLANDIRAAVLDMFKKNAGGVRVVNGEAHSDFEITLLSYTNKPMDYNSNSDVETYRVTIRVGVKFYDNVKERIIYENKSLSAEGTYDVQANETEDRHGQKRAIEKLQDLIITNALAKW
ncbi:MULTISPECIES: LptE family protein [unclassified Fibrobacter]|uniref:LptE family protein n=1 Tax=unclassified Fibrobacter TaxID=2634177 RepID=UPI000D6C0CAE|nr:MULTISPECIES: LptE family protein [unclassified Fibrobacter]PWJ62507.1 lipopolysaccharide assembly protein [Fibrobacter sp. UWR4]PZW67366.1 lipopolysaccharide assembly protein [Fibrobacter sp. UWR1]